jgi:hypothetical protein
MRGIIRHGPMRQIGAYQHIREFAPHIPFPVAKLVHRGVNALMD